MTRSLIALLALALAASAHAQRGIQGRAAPSWGVTQWTNLPEGVDALDVDDFRGRVVYLYCFQSWCPGCHKRGFPTLQRLMEHYAGDDDVAFVAVQTAFEGFNTNTPGAARQTALRYDLSIPVGHSGSPKTRSAIMSGYRTGGTPWTIIIDRAGTVRYNDFHVAPQAAITLIDRLRAAPVSPPAAPKVRTLPASRGGQDLVGTPLPALAFDHTLDRHAPASPTLTLYRWWTDGCPHCRLSLPAFERLRRAYGERGLHVVGVYHPKPPGPARLEEVRRKAEALGFHGSLAVDEQWSVLRRLYLDRGGRRATSASFLVDAEGVIRFVHPGPQIFPSDDPDAAVQNADYAALDETIRALLADPPGSPTLE